MPEDAARIAGRLYDTTAGHRVLPLAAARKLARRRALRKWRSSPDIREDATQHMAYLLGRSCRAADVPWLAQRYIEATLMRAEFLWRPWLTCDDVKDVWILQNLVRQSGVLISFLHTGQYDRIFGALSKQGIRIMAPVAPFLVADDAGSVARRHIANCRRGGTVIVPSTGSRDLLRQRLADGGVVALAHDLPGGTEVDFLGRRVRYASGIVGLSLDTGCPIVPVVIEPTARNRLRQRLRIGEPLLPGGFTARADMLQALVDRHAPAVLAAPELVERPLLRCLPTDACTSVEFGYLKDGTRPVAI
jgi:lauroyl/myristoyl acyltransferase